jgi:hypothetical protein
MVIGLGNYGMRKELRVPVITFYIIGLYEVG